MPRPPDDRAVREAIRRNVGHGAGRWNIHRPAGRATPTYLDFPVILAPGEPGAPLPPGAPGGPPLTADTLVPFAGRTFALTSSTGLGVREIIVTPRLSFAYLIRRATFVGDVTIGSQFSWRLLLSEDNDTTAVADPSGSDIIEFVGDVVGAEDPGLHGHLAGDALSVEPFMPVYTLGTYIKLKVHNNAAAFVLTAFVDIDELVPAG